MTTKNTLYLNTKKNRSRGCKNEAQMLEHQPKVFERKLVIYLTSVSTFLLVYKVRRRPQARKSAVDLMHTSSNHQ